MADTMPPPSDKDEQARAGDYVWAPCGTGWEQCRVLAMDDRLPPLLRTRSGYVFRQSSVMHLRQPTFRERLHAFLVRSEVAH